MTLMAPGAGVVRRMRWIAAALCGVAVGACTDCFFRVQGHLVDCTTNVPRSGATIIVHIDQGMHGPRAADHVHQRRGWRVQGHHRRNRDLRCRGHLTFQKEGYTAAETQFEGAPKSDVQQCLTVVAAP